MIIRTVNADEYFDAFPKSRNVFGSRPFMEVTPGNMEVIRHFVGIDDVNFTPRFGLVAGYKDGEWHAPYSAPFAELAYTKPQHLEHIYDFISELTDYLDAPLHITLPPQFYDEVMLPEITGILANYARKTIFDFDYFYPATDFANYRESLDTAARKNLNRSEKSAFVFDKTDDLGRAYEVIRINRKARGYYLAMSLDQMTHTSTAVHVDAFVLGIDGKDVASAIVYRVAEGIVQVVYWGDVPGFSHLRSMNLLAYNVFGYYAQHGIRIVDVGPSSSAGVPNSGLCRFKKSIGCRVALKPTFVF